MCVKSTYPFFCLLVVGLACSGCIPMRFLTSPGVSGMVADEQTHVPLSSAEVVVSFAHYTLTNMPTTDEGWEKIYRMPTSDREQYIRAHTVIPSLSNALAEARLPIVVTGDDGRFSIPSQKHWVLYIIPMDNFVPPPGGTLVVKKDGYEPLILSVRTRDRDSDSTNLGNIFLKPITK